MPCCRGHRRSGWSGSRRKSSWCVTDGSGQFRIVDLRPGPYAVTFTLKGFNTVKREGVELTGTGTAIVNADIKVGVVEETRFAFRRTS